MARWKQTGDHMSELSTPRFRLTIRSRLIVQVAPAEKPYRVDFDCNLHVSSDVIVLFRVRAADFESAQEKALKAALSKLKGVQKRLEKAEAALAIHLHPLAASKPHRKFLWAG